MDELPTDIVVTVDHARLSSGDAISHGADLAELLDIEMDELAFSRDRPPTRGYERTREDAMAAFQRADEGSSKSNWRTPSV